jgi:acyl CoA:acetate/3-ketoacid CoA transferase beta subunit
MQKRTCFDLLEGQVVSGPDGMPTAVANVIRNIMNWPNWRMTIEIRDGHLDSGLSWKMPPMRFK